MDVQTSYTLVRAARELLGWDQHALAAHASVGVATVRRFETGANVRMEKIEAIVGALQKAGIAFLGPESRDVDIREGVALTATKPRKKTSVRAASVEARSVQSNERSVSDTSKKRPGHAVTRRR